MISAADSTYSYLTSPASIKEALNKWLDDWCIGATYPEVAELDIGNVYTLLEIREKGLEEIKLSPILVLESILNELQTCGLTFKYKMINYYKSV